MLSSEQIGTLFEELNTRLRDCGEVGEVGIVGGAVMCLVFNARQSTRDVDAVFEPTRLIRKLVMEIGEKHHIGNQWLNDAVKGFIQGDFRKVDVLNLSNLRVWAPDARYMLAMKCISARWDTHDRDDVIFLIRHLGLERPEEVFGIIQAYYPGNRVPPKTQFMVEEVLETTGHD